MAVAQQYISPQAYLRAERISEVRHEYYAGQIYDMSGGSHAHSLIASNVIREVGNRLMDRPGETQGSDFRIKIEATGLYTYADGVILCGGSHFEHAEMDTLLNPIVIFEVLSNSTEKYDRGLTFEHYRKIPTLSQSVLISQDRAHADTFSKNGDGEWILTDADGMESSLPLHSLRIDVPLK